MATFFLGLTVLIMDASRTLSLDISNISLKTPHTVVPLRLIVENVYSGNWCLTALEKITVFIYI